MDLTNTPLVLSVNKKRLTSLKEPITLLGFKEVNILLAISLVVFGKKNFMLLLNTFYFYD